MLGFLPTRAYRPGTPGATTFLSPLSGTFNYGWDSFVGPFFLLNLQLSSPRQEHDVTPSDHAESRIRCRGHKISRTITPPPRPIQGNNIREAPGQGPSKSLLSRRPAAGPSGGKVYSSRCGCRCLLIFLTREELLLDDSGDDLMPQVIEVIVVPEEQEVRGRIRLQEFVAIQHLEVDRPG